MKSLSALGMVLGIISSVVLVAVAVAAADNAPLSNSVQAGVAYPTDSTTRDKVGNTGLHLGGSLGLSNPSLLSPGKGRPSVDLDFNHNTSDEYHLDVLGLTYAERVPLGAKTSMATGFGPYVGLGVGVYDIDVRSGEPVSGNPEAPLIEETHRQDSIGGKAMAGYDFGRTFAEATYQLTDSVHGTRTDEADLAVGIHF